MSISKNIPVHYQPKPAGRQSYGIENFDNANVSIPGAKLLSRTKSQDDKIEELWMAITPSIDDMVKIKRAVLDSCGITALDTRKYNIEQFGDISWIHIKDVARSNSDELDYEDTTTDELDSVGGGSPDDSFDDLDLGGPDSGEEDPLADLNL